ncbi:hypothetical protein PZN02_004688 [Sinorhizobium garamanticum]|uniref:Uncharacterized protein n=1 Tax=Sinorhizobium garamanticum TaxID=680247 RepID=A0ABY8DM73_9HYPH|nr:hypothetical protein [Sinorhizobium garamanticum]WEX91077.1 hypothetical protein PZN02_004688 [Sinorhizobium garamanticum]
MTRQEIIEELAALKEPSRPIDQAIALLFKYRRETVTLPAGGATPAQIKVTWYDRNGEAVGIVPPFTSNLDAAKSLFDIAFPNGAGGFSFHNGYAQAQVGDGEPAKAFNAATALCLATIKAAADLDT